MAYQMKTTLMCNICHGTPDGKFKSSEEENNQASDAVLGLASCLPNVVFIYS